MEIKIHKLKIFRYIKPKSNIREYNKNSELHSREHPGSSSDMSPQSSLPSHTCKQHPRHILHKAASIAPALRVNWFHLWSGRGGGFCSCPWWKIKSLVALIKLPWPALPTQAATWAGILNREQSFFDWLEKYYTLQKGHPWTESIHLTLVIGYLGGPNNAEYTSMVHYIMYI